MRREHRHHSQTGCAVSNQAKTKQKWASDDDAGDLLAGILDDTETDAEQERARLDAQIQARAEQERQAREAEERKRLDEAEARLRAEQSRQNQMEQRRTARMEAIRVEDLKERGEWVDPAIDEAKRKAEAERARLEAEAARARELEAQQQAMAIQLAAAQQQAQQQAQQAQAPRSKAPLFALAAVLIAVIGAGAVIAALTLGQYTPDTATYAKNTLAPKETRDLLILKAMVPLPKPEPVAEVAEVSSKPAAKRSSSRPSSKSGPAKKVQSKPKSKFKLNLDDDVFGKGGF